MVSKQEIETRLYIKDNQLYWLNGPKKNKKAGHLLKDGYICITFKLGDKKHRLHAHRILFIMYHGYLPKLVDHIDRNTSNNSKENLRDADKKINAINTGLCKLNTSGFKGVSRQYGKWAAYIKNNQRKIHLGVFKNIEDAILARRDAELKYWSGIINDI